MDRWSCVHHSMPDPARKEVQSKSGIQHGGRHFVVACSQRVDMSRPQWSYHRVPQGRLHLPLPQASRRSSNHFW
ncbi:unnamed protein product [Linum tenue]|uniref:Uncharacterized protein n=1 Tax=Linum tenue TaxID=586396 RepID=A0AAV0GS32_9ROSI|nr:unnamed protein product [Linum tenue]